MRLYLYILTASLLFTLQSNAANVERVDDGGQTIEVSDYIPYREAGVIVFQASWDTSSTQLADEVEDWSSRYADLNVLIIDVGDLRSMVARQFDIRELPSIIIIDKDGEPTGEIFDNIDDLEEALDDAGLI